MRTLQNFWNCAGFSRDRSRRVVFGFTNPRPSLENRVLGNSRSSFADQLQQTCERMQQIKRILIRRLARSASVSASHRESYFFLQLPPQLEDLTLVPYLLRTRP